MAGSAHVAAVATQWLVDDMREGTPTRSAGAGAGSGGLVV